MEKNGFVLLTDVWVIGQQPAEPALGSLRAQAAGGAKS